MEKKRKVIRRTDEKIRTDHCEVWGHFPEPEYDEDGVALALRCARCWYGMRSEA